VFFVSYPFANETNLSSEARSPPRLSWPLWTSAMRVFWTGVEGRRGVLRSSPLASGDGIMPVVERLARLLSESDRRHVQCSRG
jgi:hypothetical protein